MSVFLTGVTGYVGKHLLRYFLSLTDRQIVVCIREKNGVSGRERFITEIKNDAMFQDITIQTNLKNVRVIEKDVSVLKEDDLSDCTDVVHCAANVKFNSSIQTLLTENVKALKNIYRLCKKKRFYHISTCYVHPKANEGPYPSVRIEPGLQQSEFICNYAYSKYLGEQYLYKQKGVIDIIRLSCVGAPLDSISPMRGGAHLAVLESLERGTIPDIWIPEGMRFSAVPVDSICKAIIERTKTTHEGIQIVQYAAPPNSKAYNIGALEIGAYKSRPKTKIWSNISYSQFEAWMRFFYWFVPTILKRILDANVSVFYVSGSQTFHSDLNLPDLGPDEYKRLTISYVEQLVKLNPKYKNPLVSIGMYIYTFIKSIFLWFVGESWITRYEDQ